MSVEDELNSSTASSPLEGSIKVADRLGEITGNDFLLDPILRGEIRRSDLFPTERSQEPRGIRRFLRWFR